MRNSFLAAATAAALLMAAPASALDVDATYTGNYRDTGFHSAASDNYATGFCDAPDCGSDQELRSYSVFDLSVFFPQTVVAAAFQPYEPSAPPDPFDGYFSADPTETMAMYDVSTDIGTLIGPATTDTATYADLGSGTTYGSVTTSASDNGTSLSAPLNAAAIAAINAALGSDYFAIGGALTSISGTMDATEAIFGATPGAVPNRLVLTFNECGDGIVADGEDCDDGNIVDDGNCCSASCTFVAADTACTDDVDACTVDECDGAGTCLHEAVPGCATHPVLDASNTGFYNAFGDHVASNLAYPTGFCDAIDCGFDIELRDYTVFDLSAVSGVVVAAKFRPYEPNSPFCGYFSGDPTETLAMFDVSTPIATLTANATAAAATFADLGGGSTYGSVVTSFSDCGTSLSAPLNAAGVAAVNAALGGSYAIGGAVTSISGTSAGDEALFGATPGVVPNRLELTLNECGDGVLAGDEDCDDGNTVADGNCCSASCQFVAAGTACLNDGFACSVDACNAAGTCIHGPIAAAECLAAPATKLQISDSETAGKDKLSWAWGKGVAFAQADLGTPLAATTYSLCIYDETAGTPSLEASIDIAASASLWTSKDPKGLQYKDKAGASDGVTKAQIQAGDAGKTKIKLSATTSHLTLPTAFSSSTFFDLDTHVTVQLVNSDGTCWTSSFTSAATNTEEKFKAQTK